MRDVGSGGAGHRGAPVPPADPDSVVAAEEAAVRILTAASQSAAGLRERLIRRGFSGEAAQAATAAMVARGYVDDAAFAQAVAARRQRGGHGRIRVGAELRAKGVEDTAIEATLADVDARAEREAALGVGRRLAARRGGDLADHGERQRLGGALQRRGFDSDTVGWVLRELAQGG